MSSSPLRSAIFSAGDFSAAAADICGIAVPPGEIIVTFVSPPALVPVYLALASCINARASSGLSTYIRSVDGADRLPPP